MDSKRACSQSFSDTLLTHILCRQPLFLNIYAISLSMAYSAALFHQASKFTAYILTNSPAAHRGRSLPMGRTDQNMWRSVRVLVHLRANFWPILNFLERNTSHCPIVRSFGLGHPHTKNQAPRSTGCSRRACYTWKEGKLGNI